MSTEPKPTPEEIGQYRPAPCDPVAEWAKDLEDPVFRYAYEALEEEYAALDAMLPGAESFQVASKNYPFMPFDYAQECLVEVQFLAVP